MNIKSSEYIKSSTRLDQCPRPDLPEYAFIGRSNVGKSSLINMLTGRKGLAKTSGTPGKTTLISHFLINENWYLVDLPGYGYAKRSKSDRESWKKMINYYLSKRENLMCTFILIDSRLPVQKSDSEFMEWMGSSRLPFVLVFTKTDKLSARQLDQNLESYKNTLLESWEELPEIFLTSATSKSGRDELLSFIEETNRIFR